MDGDRPVLQEVTLEIPDGQFVAVMGPNGSGKSTLVKHLNALLLPTRGAVTVAGMDTGDPRCLYRVRETVGMVFQNPDHQMVTTVVEEEVAFGPENLGLPPALIRERVESALRAVGMEAFRLHNPAHLSGGQKQRVAIASILAMRPRVMVLDEPTAMLDAHSRQEVLTSVRRLHAEGVTVVLVTHAVDEALLADRIIFLEEGRVRLDGRPADVLEGVQAVCPDAVDLPSWVRLLQVLRGGGLDVPHPWASSAEEAAAWIEQALRGRGPAPTAPPRDADPPLRLRDADPLLRLADVHFTYLAGTPLEHPVLRGVSLEVAAGERVGLVGATGSGKTTLLQHFNGLLAPSRGTVEVCGADLARGGAERNAVRRQVGMLFQFAEHQLFQDTVAADVAYGPECLGLPRDEVERRVARALEAVGLEPARFGERSPFGLSGGEMRRAALAGVLAMEPRVLVLDEPTVGLDAQGKAQLVRVLRDLLAQRRVTLILVSHDLDLVGEMVDRVVVLEQGRVAASGPIGDLLRPDGLLPAGIPSPSLMRVSRTLRERGLALADGAVTVADLAEAIQAAASGLAAPP